MGGVNESFLEKDRKEEIIDLRKPEVKLKKQKQEIRQHISAGQVHLHVDIEKLKVAIPVSDWYGMLTKIRTMKNFTFVDTEFATIAEFKPYIKNNTFEVNIEITSIQIGPRFKQINEIVKK